MNDDRRENSSNGLLRLDKLVSERFRLSRRAATDAVRNGKVDLRGEVCDEPGTEVESSAPLGFFPSRPRARKVQTRLNVLFEDAHLLIVEKPAGVLTVPTEARERDTLLERVSRYLQVRYGGRPYVGIVHRLDKNTSGTVVVARSGRALRALQDLFRGHDIERQYLAVAEGSPRRDEGTIDLPLIAAGKGELRRRVARDPGEGGRHAVTHYRVLERFGPKAALVACWLETGRTHQIRIHLAAIGHPVAGDAVYKQRRKGGPLITFDRQALHAHILGFIHPFTQERVRVELAPPTDFRKLIERLRRPPNSGETLESAKPLSESPHSQRPGRVHSRPAWKVDHRTRRARRDRKRASRPAKPEASTE
jgi:23S rRNA pseudouridine1911/1915/1917 synthase